MQFIYFEYSNLKLRKFSNYFLQKIIILMLKADRNNNRNLKIMLEREELTVRLKCNDIINN